MDINAHDIENMHVRSLDSEYGACRADDYRDAELDDAHFDHHVEVMSAGEAATDYVKAHHLAETEEALDELVTERSAVIGEFLCTLFRTDPADMGERRQYHPLAKVLQSAANRAEKEMEKAQSYHMKRLGEYRQKYERMERMAAQSAPAQYIEKAGADLARIAAMEAEAEAEAVALQRIATLFAAAYEEVSAEPFIPWRNGGGAGKARAAFNGAGEEAGDRTAASILSQFQKK